MAWLRTILKPLASLQLTVALFALAMFLIFAGTLAQTQMGVFAATERYFRSFYAWIDLQLFIPGRLAQVPGSFPFPGGYTLIALLLANLIAAHSVRFKFRIKRTGIIVTHAGLILLLSSELFTAAFATEGNMRIDEGTYSNYVIRLRDYELAVVDSSPKDHNNTTVIPDSVMLNHLRQQKGPISHPELPFDVEVNQWMENATITRAGGGMGGQSASENPATKGLGTMLQAQARTPVAGTDAEQKVDQPAAYITLTRDGEALGTFLVSTLLERVQQPQTVEVEGTRYEISLRFERHYLRSAPDAEPIEMHLIDFMHEKFTGTDKPKAFKSEIRLVDPRRNEDRKVLIQMNEPLFYAGKTFYQSGFMPDNSGTILQVVDNPAWVLPYVSCTLISGGLVLHFGMSLTSFLRRQF
jgi:hypothetical protein